VNGVAGPKRVVRYHIYIYIYIYIYTHTHLLIPVKKLSKVRYDGTSMWINDMVDIMESDGPLNVDFD
jgi:hypothetical protein